MMSNNIIISHPQRLAKLKEIIKKDGSDYLQIISDFDRTLTSDRVNGKRSLTLMAILRHQGYLNSDYLLKARFLATKYQAIEHDPSVCIKDKKAFMAEWWQKHFDLLVQAGLNRVDLSRAMKESDVKLRSGVKHFLDFTSRHKIPLVIISATGLGEEGIKSFLGNINQLKNNIHIISNSIIWDQSGKMIGVREPIIHVLNKDETNLQKTGFFSKIKDRKNVILLGDSLSDVNMAVGFDYNNIIRIGFLNDRVEENLENFKLAYDVIILNDGSFAYINELLREIT